MVRATDDHVGGIGMSEMEFRIATHTVTGKPVVEVWQSGEFIASIYAYEGGLRIISKYIDGVEHEVAMPPSIIIKFTK